MNLPPFLTFSTKKGGTKSALKHFLSFEKDYTHYHYYYTKGWYGMNFQNMPELKEGYNTRIPLFKFGHILKVHAIPARDKGQREKYSGYDRKKLHILVLLSIDMGLISVSHLRCIFKEMYSPAHEPVGTV